MDIASLPAHKAASSARIHVLTTTTIAVPAALCVGGLVEAPRRSFEDTLSEVRALDGRWTSAAFKGGNVGTAVDRAIVIGTTHSPLMSLAAVLESSRARGATCLGAVAAPEFASRSGSVVDTLRRPQLGASERHYSVSEASRSAAAAGAGDSTTPAAALVKVGDGKWRSFEHAGLMGMDTSKLLKALKADEVFGPDLKDVKLSACTVSLLKLPSGKDEPAAEDDAKFVELKGAKRVSALAINVSAGEQVCVRVQLPATGVTTAVASPTALRALEELVELPADHPLSMFAAAVAAAKVNVATQTITLGGAAQWLDMKSNVLYLRYFYAALWEAVLNMGRSRRHVLEGGAIILGTPGIAKSAFGLYALFRAIEEGRTVVYDSFKGGFAVFKNSKAYELAGTVRLRALSELHKASTLYISDGIPPVESVAFTLLVSSPKRAIWSKFSQTPGHPQLLLPPMKKQEIMDLRRLAFADSPGCDLTSTKHLFAKWGGNARNVLAYAWDDVWQAQLEEAHLKLSLEQLKQALSTSSSFDSAASDDNFHRLLDIIPRGAVEGSTLKPTERNFYAFHHAQLSSQYVAGKFAAKMMAASREQFLDFLHALGTDPAAATFHGKLYERTIVAARLQRGSGALQLERLSPSSPAPQPALLKGATDLQLGAGVPLVRFDTPEELATAWASTKGNAVFMPYSARFPVVDFILRLDGQPLLLNSTVSDEHGIKIRNKTFRAVLEVVGLMQGTSEIPVLWVLPQDAYGRFTKPGPFKPKGAAGTKLAARIVQYKLLVEVPSATLPSDDAAASTSDSEEEDDEGNDAEDDDDDAGNDTEEDDDCTAAGFMVPAGNHHARSTVSEDLVPRTGDSTASVVKPTASVPDP